MDKTDLLVPCPSPNLPLSYLSSSQVLMLKSLILSIIPLFHLHLTGLWPYFQSISHTHPLLSISITTILAQTILISQPDYCSHASEECAISALYLLLP